MTASILDRSDTNEPEPQCVLVAGASGGIGSAICRELSSRLPSAHLIRMARRPAQLPALSSQTTDISLDIAEEHQVASAVALIEPTPPIDWVFIATGWLHDETAEPEKTYRSLNAEHLLHAYRVNAIGPSLLLKHLMPHLNPRHVSKVGILSARVGSISDNRLGGWHAYRASKAALHMLIRNFAVELARKKHAPIVVGLQPGTTDTKLSAPFQRNVPDHQLQTPAYTAAQLINVLKRLRNEDSGQLFDFLGFSFEP